ncbi:MAG: hypothetical protein C7B46_08390 [Sulfobacillus benefaciens]|uniref:Metallo-beta-lactamase domain-containing protein n=1 Tax=Sulfobacillus benefaciens TaxID=453960 RepID=A0A2T2XH75_9FIRM|nr:MAG: hypothetical protein C7B46_08390 [Sulfobacillus benefaciens]
MTDTTPSEMPKGMRVIEEFSSLRAVMPAGERLHLLVQLAEQWRRQFVGEGTVIAVRTINRIDFPYPTQYGLWQFARHFYPFLMLRHRANLIQYHDWNGALRTLLFNPTDVERARDFVPYFQTLQKMYGKNLSIKLMSHSYPPMEQALSQWGLQGGDIDYISHDHLHVQDLRRQLGTHTVTGQFPRALLLVQEREWLNHQHLHPLQSQWFVADGLQGVPENRQCLLPGDVSLGPGIALLHTPGHTQGNQTLVVNTAHGVWAISENGVSCDNYNPHASHLRGLRQHAQETRQEVVLNGNTLEGALDQYTSMLIERTIAGPCARNGNFFNVYQSSEMVPWWMTPGLYPTFSHGDLTVGDLVISQGLEGVAGA